jgi:hypothetical protein
VRIRGYSSKPKGVGEQKRLGNNAEHVATYEERLNNTNGLSTLQMGAVLPLQTLVLTCHTVSPCRRQHLYMILQPPRSHATRRDCHWSPSTCWLLQRQHCVKDVPTKAQWSLYVPHSGHCMYRTAVTICTAQWSLDVPDSGHYTYRTVVTVCTAQWSLYVPHSGHCMYRTVITICTTSLTFTNPTFSPHSVFMCFVWI